MTKQPESGFSGYIRTKPPSAQAGAVPSAEPPQGYIYVLMSEAQAHAAASQAQRIKELVDLNNKLAALNIQQRNRAETAERQLGEAREALREATTMLESILIDPYNLTEERLRRIAQACQKAEAALREKSS